MAVDQFASSLDDWAEKIEGNARRFVSIFAQVADDILPAPAVTNVGDEDVLDVLMNQRLTMQLEASGTTPLQTNEPPL